MQVFPCKTMSQSQYFSGSLIYAKLRFKSSCKWCRRYPGTAQRHDYIFKPTPAVKTPVLEASWGSETTSAPTEQEKMWFISVFRWPSIWTWLPTATFGRSLRHPNDPAQRCCRDITCHGNSCYLIYSDRFLRSGESVTIIWLDSCYDRLGYFGLQPAAGEGQEGLFPPSAQSVSVCWVWFMSLFSCFGSFVGFF